MVEKLNFPLKFYTCLECEGTQFVARTIADEEIEKGKIAPGRPTGISMKTLAIADPTKTVLSAPTMIILRDICVNCGHEQTVYIDCRVMPMTLKMTDLPKEFQQ